MEPTCICDILEKKFVPFENVTFCYIAIGDVLNLARTHYLQRLLNNLMELRTVSSKWWQNSQKVEIIK